MESRSTQKLTDTVYYSDIGLENQKALARWSDAHDAARYHRARIKALVLLSDKVLIPFSHLLGMDTEVFAELMRESADFFRNGFAEFRLDKATRDVDDFLGQYMLRQGVSASDVSRKGRLLNELEVKPSSIRYSGAGQSGLFREIMIGYVPALVKDEIDDIAVERAISIVRSSESKEAFDAKVFSVPGLSDKEGNNLLRASNYAYYLVGSKTDNAIISSNSFFNMQNLRDMGLERTSDGLPISGPLYDPYIFGFFLARARAIDSLLDLDLLGLEDIVAIKAGSSYRAFLDAYEKLYSAACDLDSLICSYDQEQRVVGSLAAVVTACMTSAAVYSIDGSGFDMLSTLLEKPFDELVEAIPKALEVLGGLTLASPFAKFILKSLPLTGISNAHALAERISRVADGSLFPLSSLATSVGDAVKRGSRL